MKKLYCVVFAWAAGAASAQVAVSSPTVRAGKESRWTFGGGIGFGLSGGSSGYGTSISISPRVGYLASPELEAGLMGSAGWASGKYYSHSMYGVGPFANYYVLPNLFLHADYRHYFYNWKDKVYDYKTDGDEGTLNLGAGYNVRLGNKAALQVGAYYNVLYKKDSSIFGSGFTPVFGVVFGI
ncbi:hypothetical protein SAMN05443429_107112 [Cruoricaptor ignavus]|uniref:Outer membrane protein beta-barrel domain-containing protein n=1 Tax=Cruoricaptor ignavus TaxID=1118202 RepID=A0A1M6FRY7_9FLAO|nr:hypothetical protein [Cruoricaptor ignavus]SHJ00456.1 hypothetical protein SAMN05443429_107112 [Cruoricaptor ignavus]